MGTVYCAPDLQTGQDVAVKVIARELALDDDLLERFRREGEALTPVSNSQFARTGEACTPDWLSGKAKLSANASP
jgi:serine/threonine protein kinase